MGDEEKKFKQGIKLTFFLGLFHAQKKDVGKKQIW